MIKINHPFKVNPLLWASFAMVAGALTAPAMAEDDLLRLAMLEDTAARPVISIQGRQVVGDKELRLSQFEEKIPARFRTPKIAELLERRLDISYFAHNPTNGRITDPVTIIEVTDLGCTECTADLKIADQIFAKFPNQLFKANIHIPADLYNSSNSGAFYSKIAQAEGKFWEFRAKIIELAGTSIGDLYTQALIETGIDTKTIRKSTRRNARKFYRELDADARLARDLQIKTPPVYFVNGLKVASSGAPFKLEDLEDLITLEILRYEFKHGDK